MKDETEIQIELMRRDGGRWVMLRLHSDGWSNQLNLRTNPKTFLLSNYTSAKHRKSSGKKLSNE